MSESWRCSIRRCSGSLTWVKQDGTIARESGHTCDPDIDNFRRQQLIVNLKQAVCDDLGPIKLIYDNYILQFADNRDYDEIIPPFLSIKTALYNARKKHLQVHVTVFKTLSSVTISRTLSENFYVAEDGQDDKIVLFCSSQAREYMNYCSHYFGDGNFKCVPPPFKQIYSIHGDIGSNHDATVIVPIIFALLPDKRQVTYQRFFRLIKTHLTNFNPVVFQTDYELSTINAVSLEFPTVITRGCFFHFSQAMRKQFKKLDLEDTNENKKLLAMYTALAHLPVQHIPEGFLTINFQISNLDNIAKWDDFMSYFTKQRLRPDILPLMSCYGNAHRTINAVESWHSRLKKIGKVKKPHLFPLIKILKNESIHSDRAFRQNSTFLPINKKRLLKYKLRDERFKKIVDDYLENKIIIEICLERLANIKF